MEYHNWKDLDDYPIELLDRSTEPIALDTETAGFTSESNFVVYFSWAGKDIGSGAGPATTPNGMAFLEAICACKRPKICHALKIAELTFLKKTGIQLEGPYHDPILMHALLDPTHAGNHALKTLARELLSKPRDDEFVLQREQARWPKPIRNLNIPQAIMHPYSVADAEDALTLFYFFKRELEAREQWDLYLSLVEAELCYFRIDQAGVQLDRERLERVRVELETPISHLQERAFSIYGEFNINSPDQVVHALTKFFPLTERNEPTKTKDIGSLKTAHDVLVQWCDDPRMQVILAWKFLLSARKMLTTFYNHITPEGRGHPQYRTTLVTGRTSCAIIPLQGIPKQRTFIKEVNCGDSKLSKECAEAFRNVRAVITCLPGWVLVSNDFAQIEYRLAAHYSGSRRLIDRLCAGEDFHRITCELVFGEYHKELRVLIKIVNYGLLYGMGEESLCAIIRPHNANPTGILRRYEENLPEMRIFQANVERIARLRGYVQDPFGRRYFFDHTRPYLMVSHLCQGTAAGIKKIGLTRIDRILHGTGRLWDPSPYKSRCIADIHDDLVLEMVPEEIELIPELVTQMKTFPQFTVPFEIETAIGLNLLEMKECRTLDEMQTTVQKLLTV